MNIRCFYEYDDDDDDGDGDDDDDDEHDDEDDDEPADPAMTGFVGPFPPPLAPLLYWNSTQAFDYLGHDYDENYHNEDGDGDDHNDNDAGTGYS